MGVPRHLQIPLSIDTSISYSLDKSMFPGLDDPRYKYEPVLMIATEPGQQIDRMNMNSTMRNTTSFQGAHACTGVDTPSTVPSSDDLLGIMDINTDDLLSGVKNTQEYVSLFEDVIRELPHSDELQYLEGPQRDVSNIENCNKHSKECFSERLTMNKCTSGKLSSTNGYPVSCKALQRTSSFTVWDSRKNHPALSLNNMDCVKRFTSNEDYVSKGLSFPASSVNNPVFKKRKRDDYYQGIRYQKKPCYNNEFLNYISDRQSSMNNCGYWFSGTGHGSQIRVM